MATVYEVVDPRFGQRLALKILTRKESSVVRFHREYRALARLHHPSIVKVLRFGLTSARQPYIAMELIDGIPVQAHVKALGRPGTPARTTEAVRIAHRIAEALAYIHERRVIHRDIKSSNVLILEDGSVKLLDLGTAALVQDAAGFLEDGETREFVGTVAYASPEQLKGASLDGRSDLYTLGVLLYRMLTGRPPFQNSDPANLAHLHFTWYPPAPAEVTPELPQKISALVMRLLSKNPDDRPENASALCALLGDFFPEQVPLDWPALLSSDPPLLEREAELAQLQELILGGAPLVLLSGPEGSGRRRLLFTAVSLLRFQLFVEIPMSLGPEGASLDGGAATDARGVALQVAVRLGPDRGIVVLPAFDWQNPDMCRILSEISATFEATTLPATIIAVCTTESPEASLDLGAALRKARQVRLRPIGESAAWRLFASILGQTHPPPRLFRRLFDLSGGWPGLLLELTFFAAEDNVVQPRAGPDGTVTWADTARVVRLPRRVVTGLEKRLSKLELREREALDLLAMADGTMGKAGLSLVLGPGAAELLAQLSFRRGILVERAAAAGPVWSFEMGAWREVLLHRLRARAQDELAWKIGSAAGHIPSGFARACILRATGLEREAQDAAFAACQERLASHHPSDVLEFLDRFTVDDSPENAGYRLHLARGGALAMAGRTEDSSDALEKGRIAWPEMTADLSWHRAHLDLAAGRWKDSRNHLEVGMRSTPRSTATRCALTLARALMDSGEFSAARGILDECGLRLPEGAGLAALHRGARAEIRLQQGQLLNAEKELREAALVLAGSGDAGGFARCGVTLAELLRLEGRFSDAGVLLSDLAWAMRMSEDRRAIASLHIMSCLLDIEMYRLGPARGHLEEVRLVLERGDYPDLRVKCALAEARIAIAANELPALRPRIEVALETAKAAHLEVLAAQLSAVRALANVLGGQKDEGLAEGRRAMTALEKLGAKPALAFAALCLTDGLPAEIDPGPVFAPVVAWCLAEPAHLPRMWAFIAAYRRARVIGDEPAARAALQAARAHLTKFTHDLAPDDRTAMRVHPWMRLLGSSDPSEPGR
jgi:hypothetical protein